MTTRDQLIFALQELYSFHRDYLPLLEAMRHEAGDARLRDALSSHLESLRVEMETVEQALNLLGARYKMERSTVDAGLKEAASRFKRQVSPSQEQLDIHTMLTVTKVAHMAVGMYEGDIEMARAIGEPDVAKLLEEARQRQEGGLQRLGRQAKNLIADISRAEARRAA